MPGCGPYRSGRRGGVSPLDGMRRGENPEKSVLPRRKKSRYFAQNQKTAKIMTGIFYGSTTGTTEAVAEDIAKQLGVASADVHNVADASADEADKYDLLVVGSSTWGCGELQDDWYSFLDALKAKDLTGRKAGATRSHIRLRRQRFLSRYVLRRRGTDLRRVAGHGMHVRRFLRARGLRFDRLAHRARRQVRRAGHRRKRPGQNRRTGGGMVRTD